MDLAKTFAISAAGMDAERTRVEIASLNLANANSALGTGGVGYEPMRAVVRSSSAFQDMVSGLQASLLPVVSVESSGLSPRKVHDPGHPLADPQGFVNYPGVDTASEMVTLMSAMRAYEANVAAMNTARALALKTLEIGRAP